MMTGFISRGGLLNPTDEMLKAAEVLNLEFNNMHGTSLSKEKHIFKTLADKTVAKLDDCDIPYEVILTLSRVRTYIRLREINKRISFENCRKRLEKKLSKFTNDKKKTFK